MGARKSGRSHFGVDRARGFGFFIRHPSAKNGELKEPCDKAVKKISAGGFIPATSQ
jgi:hypothetical protein